MSKEHGILQPGKEYLQKNEKEDILRIIEMQKNNQKRMYKDSETRRQNHNKTSGCFKAEFIVEKDLPEKLRVGLFKEPAAYPAWIRMSPQNTTARHDKKRDVRGFAIKLMNVPGEKCIDGNTHDFQLVSIPTFFINKLAEFRVWMKASTAKYNMITIPMLLLRKPHIAFRLAGMFKPCRHVMGVPYYSITPFRFGDESTAVKYMIRPSEQNVLEYVDEKDFHFLHKSAKATVARHEVYFDFCVQFQGDPYAMPIEDSTIEWTSPFVKVARIKIPIQSFTSAAHEQFSENLSFNLFRCLPEHRPLGAINRCRKMMYEALSAFRTERNKQPLAEPTAGPDFLAQENLTD
jgi:hypothetical protein